MAIGFSADEVFEMAMDIEKNGEAYYGKAASLTKDADIKAVLVDLKEQEQHHYATFKSLREKLPPRSSLPTYADPEDQEYLYLDTLVKSRLFTNVHEAESLASKVSNDIETLRSALAFEKDTILFFQGMQRITDERLGRGEIDRIIEEEHRHVVRISQLIRMAMEKGAKA